MDDSKEEATVFEIFGVGRNVWGGVMDVKYRMFSQGSSSTISSR